jgi:predicted DNA-binding transcriptional regulator AlpA
MSGHEPQSDAVSGGGTNAVSTPNENRLSDTPSSTLDLLDAPDLARMLKVRVKRVYELGIPRVAISARAFRWRVEDVKEWIEKRTIRRTA